MTQRNVNLHLRQHSGVQPNTPISVPLFEIAHAAVRETMSSGAPVCGFYKQLVSMLADDTWLRWRGEGPGIGSELKRSFSNIHGRYFARWYLERFHQVQQLLPIQGMSNFFGNGFRVEKRAGEKGHMPDWFGFTPSKFVIAEAKGSHDASNWSASQSLGGQNGAIACIETAKAQCRRVQISKWKVASDLKYKSWAVASRWATEVNGVQPWIVAIDPLVGEDDWSDNEWESAKLSMQRVFVGRALETLGFVDGAAAIEEKVVPSYEASELPEIEMPLSEELRVKGFFALSVGGGFQPLQSASQLAQIIDASPRSLEMAVVGIDSRLLNTDEAVFIEPKQNVDLTASPHPFVFRNAVALFLPDRELLAA